MNSHNEYIYNAKNGNGTQKNARIFKSNAPTWLILGVGFDHMYTKGWDWSKTTSNSFVAKGDLMQQPL